MHPTTEQTQSKNNSAIIFPILNQNLSPRVFLILGRRASVIDQAFRAAGLHSPYQARLKGPRRIWGALWETMRQLFLNKEPFHFILTDSLEYAPLAWLLSKLLKLPLLIRKRGNVWAECNHKSRFIAYRFPWGKGVLSLYEYFLRQAHAVIPVSEDLIEPLVKHAHISKNKIHIIPTSVDPQAFDQNDKRISKAQFGIPDNGEMMLTITNFRFPDKVDEIERYLPAVVQILNSNPHYCFMIAGDGPYRKRFQNKIAVHIENTEHRIRFLGHIANTPPLYNAATIFTYFSGLDSYPRVILEAFASKLPVVANPAGSISSMIAQNHTGFIIRNPDEFLDVTLRLVRNKILRDKIGDNGRKSVCLYNSPENVGRHWKETLVKLFQKRYDFTAQPY